MTELNKIILSERDMPTHWYNINADLPAAGVEMFPPRHPGTGQPLGPGDLAPLFPMALIMQEVSTERYIEIPDEVQEVYKLWRPTPLFRARRWEKALGTPAKIYYKYEGTSPAGSHKPNTAVPQAYYNMKEGVKRLATETGAGQWGSALAFACQMYGIECKVYMVKVSYEQKPYRKILMETWGASVVPSPSPDTNAGRMILAQFPDSTGSLGIAISEAVEDAATREDTKYALGSVLNHVLLHQTIIGQEVIKQLELAGADWPDVVVACTGGGSNFGGLTFPFLRENITGGKKTRVLAVEPAAAPSLSRGVYAYDYGDTAKLAPMVKMHTLGHDFIPAPIHAGGLRYHGMSAQVSALKNAGLIEAVNVQQKAIFEAGMSFTRSEGILPAPEASHGIWGAMNEALKCKESGESQTIVFNLSGHGHFDLGAYQSYLAGGLVDYEYPEEQIQASLANLPQVE
ncbi:MAG: TrpB-like pyridoxal phosphate-dependent enzyme [Caldilineaceae bacterium]|nr:TrpB-like pyridoxal phosphate-dependent enzyme [Caldilineaceae bacterium]MBP8108866.1 TrpB-like pyridoxal phosphate-dependent enzyme [Caldilineaceae bacterium]MBP8125108.1 TrpB-like pyridoxal phosphate-dependent enzyme [Caldilineaceae bacterium]MBP9074944.1 TrpB-like pyridoxal phosphate-dependent enzyme [Caldilineaceae bacterium]